MVLKLMAGVLVLISVVGNARGADRDRVVVVVSVDGLANYYWDDAKAQMPNLRALAAEGVRAASMKVSTPASTWPNHTTLVTGVSPARHGVLANGYFDRAAKKEVALVWDPVFDEGEIVKVPTIYDVAKEAGLKTAAVRWPATRGAKGLDWTVPDVGSEQLLERYTTAGLEAQCKAADAWARGDLAKGGTDDERTLSDATCVKVFRFILREHRPNLGLLHLLNVDHVEHSKGPRSAEAYAAIQVADEEVGEVWRQLKQDFAGKGTLVVVSDHGFGATERSIEPWIILQKAGLVEIKGILVAGGAVRVVSQGGSAFVYGMDEKNKASVMGRVRAAFKGVEGVTEIAEGDGLKKFGMATPAEDARAPDMVLFCDARHVFGTATTGVDAVNDKPSLKGNHGHDGALPEMRAVFVAWGAGVKAGVKSGEIENMDVAPTVARLLGVAMKGVEGHAIKGVDGE